MEGKRKVERLKNGQFDDLTVEQATRELMKSGWPGIDAVMDRLFTEGVPITLDDGTKYTGLTLRWV